ncbi:MAG: hypothetical protein H0W61_17175 [Bacteroidetes bacterium]|nr:hypothetical protein [Bacteroidota bacterium]
MALILRNTNKSIFSLMLGMCFWVSTAKAQVISLQDILVFPVLGSEQTGDRLQAEGWQFYNVEFISDSSLTRKTWVINNKHNDLKSYVQYWDFTKAPEQSYVFYQFSERKTFDNYIPELKKLGYKELKSKKKKNKKSDPNLYKEQDVLFIKESSNSLIVLKEIFIYGMNSFVISSYNIHSKMGQHLISQEKQP